MTNQEYKIFRTAVLKYSIKCRLYKINPARYGHPGKAPYSMMEIVAIEMDQVFNQQKVDDLFNRDNYFYKYIRGKLNGTN